MKIRKDLPKPTLDAARKLIERFEADNRAVEHGLTELIQAFPNNSDLGHVLVKVAAINGLYATAILGLFPVAELITGADIDPLLETGDPQAIEKIAKVSYADKTRWNYSFATKYCSWHRPDMYPMFDSRVDFCLRSYQASDPFSKFKQEDLWNYEKFRTIIKAFQSHYGLGGLTFKQLDEFLYQLGNEYFSDRPDVPSMTSPDAAAPTTSSA